MTIAALAGADAPRAAMLGLSMLCIQTSIGALNDVVDAPIDRQQKAWKPIARGLVSARWALVAAVALAVVGLVLSASVSPPAAAIIGWGLALGWVYDLRLSRTTWSWLPLALALPVVPLHAWVGATGSVPFSLVLLVPVTVLAGATLALANGLVDVDRDTAARRRTMVVRLGPSGAWLVHAVLLGTAVLLAYVFAPPVPDGTDASELLRRLRWGGLVIGGAAVAVGAAALTARRPGIRERGWELEAVGVAIIGIGWLAGSAAVGSGGA